MSNIANLAQDAIHEAARQPRTEREASPTTRKLFVLLHGSYGNLFLSKFATGQKSSDGGDKGVAAAMLVWDAALSKFRPDVVEAAARRLMQSHPDFAPNLPQLEKECAAITPRKEWIQQEGLPRLAAPVGLLAAPHIHVEFQAMKDGKDWARKILARVEAGDKSVRAISLLSARQALGLEGRQSWQ